MRLYGHSRRVAAQASGMDGQTLRDRIAAKFHVHLHERSVGKLPKKQNFSSMPGRPAHPQSDLEAEVAFKQTSPAGQRAAIPPKLAGRPVEICLQML
jgi:Winged helix-turn helix